MKPWLTRTAMVFGEDTVNKFENSTVAVFGLGGVGSYALEALARGGIGTLVLVDGDEVAESNLNRQLVAYKETIGMKKTEAAAERIYALDPEIRVIRKDVFVLPETIVDFDFSSYDYVVDAIDTVSGKLAIIEACKHAGIPVISAMGAGNKLDPTKFRVADIYETKVCPLAKVMRRELRKRGIGALKVVYSEEEPTRPVYEKTSDTEKGVQTVPKAPAEKESERPGKRIPGSVSFVPSVMGLIMAGEVLKDLASGGCGD